MSNHVNDIFEEKLQSNKEKLQACQNEKNLSTCSDCEQMFECELRRLYVRSVYESMSKGEVGGFEF